MFEFIFAALFALMQLFGSTIGDTTVRESKPPVQSVIATVTSVIDGDTIDVKLPSGDMARVRYIGIDTPEPYREGEPECGSEEASARNRELVEGKVVTLVADIEDVDQYGRLLRYVYTEEAMVNEVLINEGLADVLTIAPNTAHRDAFLRLRDQASASGTGLWGRCF